jgi:hypothetical protein
MSKTREYNLGLPPLQLPAALAAADGWHKSFDADNAPAPIKEALQAQRHAAQAWAALDEVRRSKAPAATAAAHLEKVGQLTTKTLNTAVSRAKAAIERLTLAEGDVNRKIANHLMTATSDAQEIRAVMRSLAPNPCF